MQTYFPGYWQYSDNTENVHNDVIDTSANMIQNIMEDPIKKCKSRVSDNTDNTNISIRVSCQLCQTHRTFEGIVPIVVTADRDTHL